MTAALVAPLATAHASGLRDVSQALERLHRERLRASVEPASPVHAFVCNLVAACNDPSEAERAAADLAVIGQHHPARAIVVNADPRGRDAIQAEVSLQCPTARASARCTEMVRLAVRGEPAYHLASVVTPLLVADVPVHLWVVGAPPLQQPFTDDVVAMCERILVDSGAYDDGAAALHILAEQLERHGAALWLSDLAWERIRPWRVQVARAFDSSGMRPLLRRISAVAVHGDTRHSDALLLGGWLRERLGISVHLEHTDDAPLASVLLRWHGGEVSVRRFDETLVTDVCGGATPFSARTALPRFEQTSEEAQLITRLIAETSDDPTFRAALAVISDGGMT